MKLADALKAEGYTEEDLANLPAFMLELEEIVEAE
jgi:hypothetical protein